MWRSYYSILKTVTRMNVVAIVNPLSGAGADPDAASARVRLLEERCLAAGVAAEVHVTERARHASELAAAALASGAALVLAWGGDGTINEVGSVVAGTAASMGIIPAGSGNGFAAELGVPRDPAAAIDAALMGRERPIDVGEMDGRYFFNIAGIGVDAVIAEQFNARALGRRGMRPYVQIGVREAFRYRAHRYRIALDGDAFETQALLIAFANGREYGNRVRLAPHARLDDGRLEAVIVEDRPPLARLWSARHLMFGTPERADRVILRSVRTAEIRCEGPIRYHLDGETGSAEGHVSVRVLPGYLRVRVPAEKSHER